VGLHKVRHAVELEIHLGQLARMHRCAEAFISVAAIDPARLNRTDFLGGCFI
jgi:hypothetical protein